MDKDNYQLIKNITTNATLLWKVARGFAPDDVADILDDAKLDWMLELTNTLELWIDKGESMSEGELLLARVNMGALVESWLKLFYCVYNEDYAKSPIREHGRPQEAYEASFAKLIEYTDGTFFEDKNDPLYAWIDKIRKYRNSIHAFMGKNIGTAKEFLSDIDEFKEFVEKIHLKLPPIEDYVDDYPAGYILNVFSVDNNAQF